MTATYYVKRSGDLFELRQIRFRDRLALGTEHPHDVCAIGRSVDEIRRMVETYHLGETDFTTAED